MIYLGFFAFFGGQLDVGATFWGVDPDGCASKRCSEFFTLYAKLPDLGLSRP
jgi:hypothetical protein